MAAWRSSISKRRQRIGINVAAWTGVCRMCSAKISVMAATTRNAKKRGIENSNNISKQKINLAAARENKRVAASAGGETRGMAAKRSGICNVAQQRRKRGKSENSGRRRQRQQHRQASWRKNQQRGISGVARHSVTAGEKSRMAA